MVWAAACVGGKFKKITGIQQKLCRYNDGDSNSAPTIVPNEDREVLWNSQFRSCYPAWYHCKLNMRKCDSSQASYIRRPESACSSNNFLQNPNRAYFPRSKIQDPRTQNLKSKTKIQNSKSNWARLTFHIKNGYYHNPKSQIKNPRSNIKNPKSKIQNPKSKIQDPKSKIRNSKSKTQNPKPKIQQPKSKIQMSPLDFGFWIWDGGARAM